MRGSKCMLLAALFLAAPVAAAAGPVDGVASWRGELQKGVRVWSSPSPALDPGEGAPAGSVTTDASGKFSMELPSGTHYLFAFKKGNGRKKGFEPGDLYCFYSGNPVIVEPGRPARVGFNLIRIPEDGGEVAGYAGVEGTVLFEGAPLGKSYIYVYTDASDGFRGMGFYTAPVGADGRFRVKLPPGRYYLICRKREEGGMYGPLSRNDKVGYYYGNPVEVAAGRTRRVILEVTRRVESTGEGEADRKNTVAGVLSGTVRDKEGKPVAGLRVLLYDNPETSGKPRWVSPRTGKDGSFALEVPGGGTYYLVARRNLGGPPEEGEPYGRYEDRSGKAVAVTVGGPGAGKALRLGVDAYAATPR